MYVFFQGIICLCLREFLNIEGVFFFFCDWNCFVDDDSYVNDCGGSDIFNVYRVIYREQLQSGKVLYMLVLYNVF